jgi:Lipase (class 3)
MRYVLIALLLSVFTCLEAQDLHPGFSKSEYVNLMMVSAQFGDSTYASKLPPPAGYKLAYASPVVGLDNKWELWQNEKNEGIISIRGTTAAQVSWLANFYAAMLPAKGELKLADNETFNYNLSDNPRAAVHAGWLVATGFMAKAVLSKIDSLHKTGVKNFFIIGHSQGGGIGFLLTAYLLQMQKSGGIPADIRFKTYCSAGPKPGNLDFAYDYEAMTRGWAFNVVNAADWVPQMPLTVQTTDDFAPINPFTNAKDFIKKQSWPKRWVLNVAYTKLSKPGRKTLKRYQKYLGTYMAKAVKKNLKGFQPPAYYNSSEYVRTGNTIVLMPKEDYYKLFPQDPEKIFINHFHAPYLFLVNQLDESMLH